MRRLADQSEIAELLRGVLERLNAQAAPAAPRVAESLLRHTDAMSRLGMPRSSFYRAVEIGLVPRPVRAGGRSVRWPSLEIDALIAARIAGATDDEIRALVARLESGRRNGGKP